MQRIAGKPYWLLTFDADGGAVGDTAAVVAEIAAAGVRNLFVVSHGWNTQPHGADDLYERMFPLIAAAAARLPGLDGVGFVGISWPSIWFPDDAGTSGGPGNGDVQSAGSVAAQPTNVTTKLSGAEISAALADSYSADLTPLIQQMGQLIDQGQRAAAAGTASNAQQQADVEAFHRLLQQVSGVGVGPDSAEDDGESALFSSVTPVQDYATLADTMSTATAANDAQLFGIDFGKIWNGAKDAVRVASFWEMKARAGVIGRTGLAPVLEALHTAAPTTRVHLIGHSFGGRLVSSVLPGISAADSSPVASLLLIQGAFSHWAFAGADMPFGTAGSLHGFVDRVHGPLVATFTRYDWAVGVWYPKASFLSGDFVQANVPPKWGGMGSDGFQSVSPSTDLIVGPAGTSYQFTPGTFHRADANQTIADTGQSAFAGAHGDFVKPEIAWLAAAVAATGS